MVINKRTLELQLARKFLTQVKLAEQIGMTKENLSRIVQGHQKPTPDNCRKLCEALDVTFDELFIVADGGTCPSD